MKYIQVQSSTTWFKRMFLYGNLSTKIRRHLQYSLTIYGGHILQIIALSINISLYWTKIFEEFIKYNFVAGGRGVGEKPEYLEANLQLDCQHIFSLQKERKLVNACQNEVYTNIYICKTKHSMYFPYICHSFLLKPFHIQHQYHIILLVSYPISLHSYGCCMLLVCWVGESVGWCLIG